MSIFPTYKETTFGDRNERATKLLTLQKLIPGAEGKLSVQLRGSTNNNMLYDLATVVNTIKTIAALLTKSSDTSKMIFDIDRHLVDRYEKMVPFTTFNYTTDDDTARIRIRPNTSDQSINGINLHDEEYREEHGSRRNIKELTSLNALLKTNDKHAVRVFTMNQHIEIYSNVLTWEIIYTALTFPMIKNLDANEAKNFPEIKDILSYLAMGKIPLAEAKLKEILSGDRLKQYCMLQVKNQLFQNSDAVEKRHLSSIASFENEASNAYTAYIKSLQNIENEKIALEAARAHCNDKDPTEEIINFLMKNKYIKYILPMPNEQYNNTWKYQIILLINSPLTDFDDAAYSRTIVSTLNSKLPGNSPSNDLIRTLMLMAFDAVFQKQTYRAWTYAAIKMDTATYAVENLMDSSIIKNPRKGFPQKSEWQFGLPQPHISMHSCWGSYREQITKWLRSPDYLGVFNQIVQATTNINFTDSTVARTLVSTWMQEPDKVAFENMEDGTFVSLIDMLRNIIPVDRLESLRPSYDEHNNTYQTILSKVFEPQAEEPMCDLDLTQVDNAIAAATQALADNVLGTEFGIEFRQTTPPVADNDRIEILDPIFRPVEFIHPQTTTGTIRNGHDDTTDALAFAFDDIQGRPANHE